MQNLEKMSKRKSHTLIYKFDYDDDDDSKEDEGRRVRVKFYLI